MVRSSCEILGLQQSKQKKEERSWGLMYMGISFKAFGPQPTHCVAQKWRDETREGKQQLPECEEETMEETAIHCGMYQVGTSPVAIMKT